MRLRLVVRGSQSVRAAVVALVVVRTDSMALESKLSVRSVQERMPQHSLKHHFDMAEK